MAEVIEATQQNGVENETVPNETAAYVDVHNVANHTDRDNVVLLPPDSTRRVLVEQIYRGVIVNTRNARIPPVVTPRSSRQRFTLRRKVVFCCSTGVIFAVVSGIIAGVTFLRHNNSTDNSYGSSTHDWTTNSDSSIPDKGDVTHDIDWWSDTKKPVTPGPTWTKVTPKPTWHGKVVRETGIPYKNWTQATVDCTDNGVAPCNLYAYSCGGWIAKTPIPDHYTHVDRFQELGRRVSKIVKSYIEKSNRKTPEEKKASLFYNHCNNYGRSDRYSVLTSLHNRVKQLSDYTLTEAYSTTDMEKLLASINKLNSWPIFQLLPRASTDNKTVIAVSLGDVSINLEHLAKFSVPNMKLKDDIMEEIKSKMATLESFYGKQPKYMSTSSLKTRLKMHTNINALIFHLIWKLPLRREDSLSYNPYFSSRETGDTANKLAEDILALEVDLLLARIPGDKTSATTTSKEFTVFELQRKCGIFSWQKYLRAITSKTVSKVVLLMPDAVLKTCDVIKKYTGYSSLYSTSNMKNRDDGCKYIAVSYRMLSIPRKKLQNYLLVRLVKDHLKYYGESILLDDSLYTDKIATTEKATRSAQCMVWTDKAFGLVTGSIYLKKTKFSSDIHRNKVATILYHVRDHYRTLLQKSIWLDEKTRRTAVSKLDNMYIKLLYPPMIRDSAGMSNYYREIRMNSHNWYTTVIEWMEFEFTKMENSLSRPLDRSVWPISPIEINAIHAPWLNDITITAAILQPPFFDYRRPMAMNFGALGSIIGHEITHSFGDGGRHYNQFGQMEDWVTSKCKAQLQKKSKCFLDLYKSINTKFDKLIGNRTLEEDVADNGGINAAYGAYHTWKLKNTEHLSKDEEAWMKAEKKNLDQLFFVAYSQMYCGKWNEQWLKTLSSRKHSPGLLRVKGPFETNEFIRSAFSCRDSRTKQCTLW